MIMIARVYLPLLTIVLMFALCFSRGIGFQAREHLTPQEIDQVKDNQILDKRIDVFIKAADRRVLALKGTDASSAKQLKPAEAQAKDDAELSSFEQLTENADAIVQAASKLPPPVEKKGKSKSEKSKDTN